MENCGPCSDRGRSCSSIVGPAVEPDLSNVLPLVLEEKTVHGRQSECILCSQENVDFDSGGWNRVRLAQHHAEGG